MMRLCCRCFTVALQLLQLSTLIDDVCGRLVVVPDNAAVLTGNSVTFQCRTNTNSSVQWLLTGLDFRYPTLIVSNNTVVNERFEDRVNVVNHVEGQFDLRVTNVTMQQDPGTYTCVETATGETASAVLTVLGHNPLCETSAIEDQTAIGELFTMSCHVTYNGSLWQRPQLSWYLNLQLVSNSSHVPNPNVAVWSSYSVTPRPPRVASHICRLSFTTPVPSDDQPLNLSQRVPRYFSTCNTLPVRVVPGPLTWRPTTATTTTPPPPTTTTTTTTTTPTTTSTTIITATARPLEPIYLTTNYTWTTVPGSDDSVADSFAIASLLVGSIAVIGFLYFVIRGCIRRHGNRYSTMDVIDMEWSPMHSKHF